MKNKSIFFDQTRKIHKLMDNQIVIEFDDINSLNFEFKNRNQREEFFKRIKKNMKIKKVRRITVSLNKKDSEMVDFLSNHFGDSASMSMRLALRHLYESVKKKA